MAPTGTFTSEPESTGRLHLAQKLLARDANADTDLLPAKQEHGAATGREVPDARTCLTGRCAVSLANKLDEEGEESSSGPVATTARTVVDPTQEEHQPTPIAPLGADLSSAPRQGRRCPNGQKGSGLGSRSTQRSLGRATLRRAARSWTGQSPEGVIRPTPEKGMNRPPGFAPGPVSIEAPGGRPSRLERRWAPSIKDFAQQAAPSRSTHDLARRVTKRLNRDL